MSDNDYEPYGDEWVKEMKKRNKDELIDLLKTHLLGRKKIYDKGYTNGMTVFAHWDDGKQWVGSMGKSLETALKTFEEYYNYEGNIYQ